jgi:sec-independent protein translocase protein TatB
MFDIGWGELLIIGIVALIAIGPKELPGVMRMIGQWMAKVRSMASEFRGQLQDAMREAEMAELKKQVEEMSAAAVKKFEDPIEDARRDIEGSVRDKPATPASPVEPAPQAAPEIPAAPPTAPATTPPNKAGEGA